MIELRHQICSSILRFHALRDGETFADDLFNVHFPRDTPSTYLASQGDQIEDGFIVDINLLVRHLERTNRHEQIRKALRSLFDLFMSGFDNQFQFDFATKRRGKALLRLRADQFDCFAVIFQ